MTIKKTYHKIYYTKIIKINPQKLHKTIIILKTNKFYLYNKTCILISFGVILHFSTNLLVNLVDIFFNQIS